MLVDLLFLWCLGPLIRPHAVMSTPDGSYTMMFGTSGYLICSVMAPGMRLVAAVCGQSDPDIGNVGMLPSLPMVILLPWLCFTSGKDVINVVFWYKLVQTGRVCARCLLRPSQLIF